MNDKRKYKRFSAFLSVLLHEVGTVSNTIKCRTFNVSEGGVGVYCENKLLEGSLLELSINPVGATTPIKAVAQVVWTQAVSNFCYNAGLNFIDINERDRRGLVNAAYSNSPYSGNIL